MCGSARLLCWCLLCIAVSIVWWLYWQLSCGDSVNGSTVKMFVLVIVHGIGLGLYNGFPSEHTDIPRISTSLR